MFAPQKIGLPLFHEHFLRLDIINRDPSYVAYIDSRIKILRERIEKQFMELQQLQHEKLQQMNLFGKQKCLDFVLQKQYDRRLEDFDPFKLR